MTDDLFNKRQISRAKIQEVDLPHLNTLWTQKI
jgi:hypothetical protein